MSGLDRGLVRRVVTAVAADGTSVFDVDEAVAPVVRASTGYSLWWLWGADAPVAVPVTAGQAPASSSMFPAPGGYRAYVLEFPAAGESFDDVGEWPTDGLPGSPMLTYIGDGGLHWTPTVEVIFVLSGSIGLRQGDGELKILHPGDCVVQNGATHVWCPQAGRARVAFVSVGAVQVGAATP